MALPMTVLATALLTSLCIMLTRARANLETAHKSVVSRYRGYGVADAWARVIWNRFPAEVYPLYLTPYIEAGRAPEARERSRVRGLLHDDLESYAGYLTVDKRYHSNMFFWFFPAEDPSNAPVLLWLNGGPGRSSLVGAMLQNGPIEYTTEGKIIRRKTAWTKLFSMIYIDNPVGTGYSFTHDEAGYSRSMNDVARNLYSTLTQFFQLFPQHLQRDFYIGGQSYAGKYVPSLGYFIHNQNHGEERPEIHINFQGIYLGAGFCSPVIMMPVFPDFLYNLGLVSDNRRRELKEKYNKLISDGLSGKHMLTPSEYSSAFFADPSFAGMLDNVLGEQATITRKTLFQLSTWKNSLGARLALHVGYALDATELYTSSRKVRDMLKDEFLQDTISENAFLMDNYKVLHYSGNLDVIVNVPMTEAFLASVPWSGQAEYKNSNSTPWVLGQELAGFVTRVKNFTRVVVRNSGHMVPSDQPEWALKMMERFIFDKPFETYQ